MFGLEPSVFTMIFCWFFLAPILGIFVAIAKKRSSALWALLCFVLGFVALLVLICLPKLDNRKRVPCPNCQEMILQKAKLCPFCKNKID